MMNRILKRPMFRMGGRSDDGIMSLRPGYENGGPTFDEIVAAERLKKPGNTCKKTENRRKTRKIDENQ